MKIYCNNFKALKDHFDYNTAKSILDRLIREYDGNSFIMCRWSDNSEISATFTVVKKTAMWLTVEFTGTAG